MKRSPEVSGHAQAKAVNRADLVRWLQRAGESPIGLERVARFAGFELETKKVKQGKQGPQVIQTKEVTAPFTKRQK